MDLRFLQVHTVFQFFVLASCDCDCVCDVHRKKKKNEATEQSGYWTSVFSVQMINRIAIYKPHFAHAHTDMVRLFLVTTLQHNYNIGHNI